MEKIIGFNIWAYVQERCLLLILKTKKSIDKAKNGKYACSVDIRICKQL
jgi:hypothetical protein